MLRAFLWFKSFCLISLFVDSSKCRAFDFEPYNHGFKLVKLFYGFEAEFELGIIGTLNSQREKTPAFGNTYGLYTVL